MIQIKCKGNRNVKLEELKILQDGKNFILKDLSKKNFNRIKKSLIDNGFLFPFFGWFCTIESTWYVIDGTQRLKTLLKMRDNGMEIPKEFPLIEVQAENKKSAARAILLQSSRYGKITQEGFDGFIEEFSLNEEWLDVLDFPEVLVWDEEKEIEIDEKINEIPNDVEKKVVAGDLWQLGNHKLICGDCTKKETLERLLDYKTNIFVFTDPPYGINVVNKDGTVGRKSRIYKKIAYDENTNAAKKFYELAVQFKIKDFIIFGGNYFLDFLPRTDGFSWLFWDKRRADVKNMFADGELMWTNVHTVLRIYRQVWYGADKEGEERGTAKIHPTQKPVQMLVDVITNHIPNDRIILDVFSGSGSILLAAEKLNRTCYAVEIDKEYCDMIISRFEKETGKKAVKIN